MDMKEKSKGIFAAFAKLAEKLRTGKMMELTPKEYAMVVLPLIVVASLIVFPLTSALSKRAVRQAEAEIAGMFGSDGSPAQKTTKAAAASKNAAPAKAPPKGVLIAEADCEISAQGVITKYKGWEKGNIIIPASVGGKAVKGIGKGAFQKLGLTGVAIPEGVETIGEQAFSGNELAFVSIPGSVHTIGNYAFKGDGAAALATATLGANIGAALDTQVGRNIYYDYIANNRQAGTYTTRETDADIRELMELQPPHTEDGFFYYRAAKGILIMRYNGSSAAALRIPESINKLPVRVIFGLNQKGIERVLIPDSVTYIGENAFSGNKLTSITIPDSVTYIGSNAFAGNQLTNATIPDSVTHIAVGAFYNNKLTSVTIGNGVTYIGQKAFSGEYGNKLTSVTIGNGVTYIGDQAFWGNALTSVTISNGVTYLGGFSSNKLTSVTIPDSVTYIGNSAFDRNQLTSVTIPNGVTYLGGFSSNKLTSITIPDSVTSIGNSAFDRNQLTSVTLGNGVTYIGSEAFDSNPLTSVTIPNSVTYIGRKAFENKSITIGSGVNVQENSISGHMDFGTAYKKMV